MVPRMQIPERTNKFYISKQEGGLNPATPRPKGSKLFFANCVFYAIGRFAELWGMWLRSTNAENFIAMAKELGLQISKTPVPGAIIVWSVGVVGDGKDGAGHVAVVEAINANGSIITSESGWRATKPFWTQTRQNNGNWGQSKEYKFGGFILPPKSAKPKEDNMSTTIREGDKGDNVRKLQEKLFSLGFLRKTEIDGDFGLITLGALLAFQFKRGLAVDGICGPKTREALKL